MGGFLVRARPPQVRHNLQNKVPGEKRRRSPRINHENRHHVAQIPRPLHHDDDDQQQGGRRYFNKGEPSFPPPHRRKHGFLNQAPQNGHLRRILSPSSPHAPSVLGPSGFRQELRLQNRVHCSEP